MTYGWHDAQSLAGRHQAYHRLIQVAHDGVSLLTKRLCLLFCLRQDAVRTSGGDKNLDALTAAAQHDSQCRGKDGGHLLHGLRLLLVVQAAHSQRQQPVETSHHFVALVVCLHLCRGVHHRQAMHALEARDAVGNVYKIIQLVYFFAVETIADGLHQFVHRHQLGVSLVLLVCLDLSYFHSYHRVSSFHLLHSRKHIV